MRDELDRREPFRDQLARAVGRTVVNDDDLDISSLREGGAYGCLEEIAPILGRDQHRGDRHGSCSRRVNIAIDVAPFDEQSSISYVRSKPDRTKASARWSGVHAS